MEITIFQYMGTWYDIESYPQEFQNGTCSTATYTLTDNGVEVYNTQVINESLDDIYGLAVPDNDDGFAKLIVTFPIAGTECMSSHFHHNFIIIKFTSHYRGTHDKYRINLLFIIKAKSIEIELFLHMNQGLVQTVLDVCIFIYLHNISHKIEFIEKNRCRRGK